MTTEIGLIVGLITGLVISFLFTRALMKNKIEIAKATVENEKKEQFLILEKEKSQLEERVLKIGGLELDLSQNRE
jgi:uncharacterized membrane-anchored protein YhcB (DUF1043 family)